MCDTTDAAEPPDAALVSMGPTALPVLWLIKACCMHGLTLCSTCAVASCISGCQLTTWYGLVRSQSLTYECGATLHVSGKAPAGEAQADCTALTARGTVSQLGWLVWEVLQQLLGASPSGDASLCEWSYVDPQVGRLAAGSFARGGGGGCAHALWARSPLGHLTLSKGPGQPQPHVSTSMRRTPSGPPWVGVGFCAGAHSSSQQLRVAAQQLSVALARATALRTGLPVCCAQHTLRAGPGGPRGGGREAGGGGSPVWPRRGREPRAAQRPARSPHSPRASSPRCQPSTLNPGAGGAAGCNGGHGHGAA